MSEIKVTSLVGYRTGAALVQLEWGAQKGQLTAAEARAHALRVLECAALAGAPAGAAPGGGPRRHG